MNTPQFNKIQEKNKGSIPRYKIEWGQTIPIMKMSNSRIQNEQERHKKIRQLKQQYDKLKTLNYVQNEAQRRRFEVDSERELDISISSMSQKSFSSKQISQRSEKQLSAKVKSEYLRSIQNKWRERGVRKEQVRNNEPQLKKEIEELKNKLKRQDEKKRNQMLELLQSEKTNHKNEKNNFETKLLEMKEQKIEWQKKHIKLESMLMKEIKQKENFKKQVLKAEQERKKLSQILRLAEQKKMMEQVQLLGLRQEIKMMGRENEMLRHQIRQKDEQIYQDSVKKIEKQRERFEEQLKLKDTRYELLLKQLQGFSNEKEDTIHQKIKSEEQRVKSEEQYKIKITQLVRQNEEVKRKEVQLRKIIQSLQKQISNRDKEIRMKEQLVRKREQQNRNIRNEYDEIGNRKQDSIRVAKIDLQEKQRELMSHQNKVKDCEIEYNTQIQKYEEQIKGLKMKVYELQFNIMKQEQLNRIQLQIERKRCETELEIQNSKYNKLNEIYQETIRQKNINKQSLKASIIKKQKVVDSLVLQNQRLKNRQILYNQQEKIKFEQIGQELKRKHKEEVQTLSERIRTLVDSNERYMGENHKYAYLEKEMHQMKSSSKQRLSISQNIHHLWQIKEKEYENINNVLKYT